MAGGQVWKDDGLASREGFPAKNTMSAPSVAPQKADGATKASPSSSGSMAKERRAGSGNKTPSDGERAGTAARVEPSPSSGEKRMAIQSKSKEKTEEPSQPSVKCPFPSTTTCRIPQTQSRILLDLNGVYSYLTHTPLYFL